MNTQQADVVSIAFGGEGIIKQDGLVTFVPYTAAGDTICFTQTQKKKNFAKGKLLSIVSPSPDRTLPICPHFTHCKGCQFQHVRYETQLQYKICFVQDALNRIAKIQSPAVKMTASPQPYHYRKHISVKLQPVEGKLQLGYMADEFFPVQMCPIFAGNSIDIFKNIQALISQLEPYEGSLRIIHTEEGVVLAFYFAQKPPSFDKVAAAHAHLWKGICLNDKASKDAFIPLHIGGAHFQLSPYSFMQANSFLTEKLYHDLMLLVEGKNVLDLYCGSGILSVLLAQKGLFVTGIESSLYAVESARKNAQIHSVTPTFYSGLVEKLLPQLLQKSAFDTLIVNPPRTGLHPEVAEVINTSNISKIIYMSCMPPTLARDLTLLSKYHISHISAYDMFPQTTHLETITVLTQISG